MRMMMFSECLKILILLHFFWLFFKKQVFCFALFFVSSFHISVYLNRITEYNIYCIWSKNNNNNNNIDILNSSCIYFCHFFSMDAGYLVLVWLMLIFVVVMDFYLIMFFFLAIQYWCWCSINYYRIL